MIISEATLEILKNLASINTNLLVREGSELRTWNASENIFVVAAVEEEFVQEFAIYELNSLLQLLSLAKGEEVEFGENSLTITKDEGTFEYFYADPSVIKAPPTKTPVLDELFQFELLKSDIDTINKAASIVGAKTINIIAEQGIVTLVLGDPGTPGANKYKKVLGKFKGSFDAQLAIENFVVISMDYTVTLSKKKVLHFKNEDRGLQYWLALQPKSVV